MNKVLTFKTINGVVILGIPDGEGSLIYRQLNLQPYEGNCNNLELYCCSDTCCPEFIVNSPNGTVSVVIDGRTYSIEVDHEVNPDGSITLNDGTVIPAQITYSVDDSRVNTDGVYDIIDSNGNSVGEINVCSPDCPPISALANDDTFIATNCDWFYGSLGDNDTLCDRGLSVFKLVPPSVINATNVVIGSNGEFVVSPLDCSLPISFNYLIECVDGSTSVGSVNINFPSPTGAASTDDNFSGPNGGSPLGFNVAVNDTLCSPADVTTFELNSPSSEGTVILSANGEGFFIPFNPNFSGTTTFTYNILCNGVVEDTSTVTLVLVEASAQDDFIITLSDGVVDSFDATSNDTICTPPTTTTYQWNADFIVNPSLANTGFGATITGTPDSFQYTGPSDFCGSDWVRYDQLCDGVVFDTATAFILVSCGNAIGDSVISEESNPVITGSVSDNDFQCSYGVDTSYILVDDLDQEVTTFPFQTSNPEIVINSWDSATGQYEAEGLNNVEGLGTVSYYLTCNVLTSSQRQNKVDLEISILPPDPVSSISVTYTSGSSHDLTLGAYLERYNGTKIPLDSGDIISLTIPEIGINTDFIVGSDMLDPLNYTDNGARSWSTLVPHIPQSSVVLNPNDLLLSNISFGFNKRSFAIAQGEADNLIGVDSGLDYNFNLTSTDLSTSKISTASLDTLPVMYGITQLSLTSTRGNVFCNANLHYSSAELTDSYENTIPTSNYSLSVVAAEPDTTSTLTAKTVGPVTGLERYGWCTDFLNANITFNSDIDFISTSDTFYLQALEGLDFRYYNRVNTASNNYVRVGGGVFPFVNHVDKFSRSLGDYDVAVNNENSIMLYNSTVVDYSIAIQSGQPSSSGTSQQFTMSSNNSGTTRSTERFNVGAISFPTDGVYEYTITLSDGSGNNDAENNSFILVYSF